MQSSFKRFWRTPHDNQLNLQFYLWQDHRPDDLRVHRPHAVQGHSPDDCQVDMKGTGRHEARGFLPCFNLWRMICIDLSGVPSLANSFAWDDLRRRPVFFWRQTKSLPERFTRSYGNTCCRYTIHHGTLYDKIMCEDWWDRELHLGTPLCRTPHVTICVTNSTRRVGVYFASIAAFEAFRNFGGQLLIDVRLRLLCSPKHSVAILHLFAISISVYFCNFMWSSVANGVEMAWRNNALRACCILTNYWENQYWILWQELALCWEQADSADSCLFGLWHSFMWCLVLSLHNYGKSANSWICSHTVRCL